MSESLRDHQDGAVRRESCLHYMIAGAAGETGTDCGVVLCEAPFKGHLSLRGNPNEDTFRHGVAEVLGLELPIEPGTCISNGDKAIYWLGPTEWLLIVASGSEANVEARLRETLQGHYSVVDVSGGQTLVRLSGEAVAMVLKKSSGYDFHSSEFAVGRCVQTTFAKASALVSKTAEDCFDLVIRRSFSDYLLRWLVDASSEYGIEVGSESEPRLPRVASLP